MKTHIMTTIFQLLFVVLVLIFAATDNHAAKQKMPPPPPSNKSSATATAAKELPDLEVTDLGIDNSCTLSITIKNRGNGPIDPNDFGQSIVTVNAGKTMNQIRLPMTKLDPKGILMSPGSILKTNTEILITVDSLVVVEVDGNRKIPENNSANNVRSEQLSPKCKLADRNDPSGSNNNKIDPSVTSQLAVSMSSPDETKQHRPIAGVAIQKVDTKNDKIVVTLKRLDKRQLLPEDAQRMSVRLSIGNMRRQWPLILIDPGLSNLNGPKQYVTFDTGVTLKEKVKVVVELNGGQQLTPLTAWLAPVKAEIDRSTTGAPTMAVGTINKKENDRSVPSKLAVASVASSVTSGASHQRPDVVPLAWTINGIRVTKPGWNTKVNPGGSVLVDWEDPNPTDDVDTVTPDDRFIIGLFGNESNSLIEVLNRGRLQPPIEVTLPRRLENGTEYFIRVTRIPEDENVYGESPPFLVGMVRPRILLFPLRGSSDWEPGSTQRISWMVYPEEHDTVETWILTLVDSNNVSIKYCLGVDSPECTVSNPESFSYDEQTHMYSVNFHVPADMGAPSFGAASVSLSGECPANNTYSGCSLDARLANHVTIVDPDADDEPHWRPADPSTHLLTITAPTAGGILKYGNRYNITWQKSDDLVVEGENEAAFGIDLVGEGIDDSIATIRPSEGNSWEWDISNIEETINRYPPGNYRIRLSTKYGYNQHVVTESSRFSLALPTIEVTAPGRGTSWRYGARQTINWSGDGVPIEGSYAIKLYRNDRFLYDIAHGIDARLHTQTYEWVVGIRADGNRPQVWSNFDDCRIVVEYTQYPQISGSSQPFGLQFLPEGSYTETCRDYNFSGVDMRARCRTRSGNYRRTELQLNRCRYELLTNINGHLMCEPMNPPRGSYLESCRDVFIGGDSILDIRAECRTISGSYQETFLYGYNNACDPSSDISNNNGNLFCHRR